MHTAIAAKEKRPYSVSELVETLRNLLEENFPSVWVQGEVGGLTIARSGHAYFSLKDDRAQLRCVAFRSAVQRLGFELAEGTEILLRGRPGIYSQRGALQIVLQWAEPLGAGDLRAEFERLKRKLEVEGLFADHWKKPLPYLPRRVAVITSPTGAAIRDVISVLRRRNPCVEVRIVPSPVQGRNAGRQLAAAVRLAQEEAAADLLIVTRGGGSADDLACFNDEELARAIFSCHTPVISAVGHEVDFTIADFVADHRAPTPSAAAELVTPVREELLQKLLLFQQKLRYAIGVHLKRQTSKRLDLDSRLRSRSPGRRVAEGVQRLDELERRLDQSLKSLLERKGLQLGRMAGRLAHPGPRPQIGRYRLLLQSLDQRTKAAIRTRLAHGRSSLERLQAKLHGLDPRNVLERGYSITRKEGRVLTDVRQVKTGEILEIELQHGRLFVAVQELSPPGNKRTAPEG